MFSDIRVCEVSKMRQTSTSILAAYVNAQLELFKSSSYLFGGLQQPPRHQPNHPLKSSMSFAKQLLAAQEADYDNRAAPRRQEHASSLLRPLVRHQSISF